MARVEGIRCAFRREKSRSLAEPRIAGVALHLQNLLISPILHQCMDKYQQSSLTPFECPSLLKPPCAHIWINPNDFFISSPPAAPAGGFRWNGADSVEIGSLLESTESTRLPGRRREISILRIPFSSLYVYLTPSTAGKLSVITNPRICRNPSFRHQFLGISHLMPLYLERFYPAQALTVSLNWSPQRVDSEP
jgi:hypothetical protein